VSARLLPIVLLLCGSTQLGAQTPSLRIGDTPVAVERRSGGAMVSAQAFAALGGSVELDEWRTHVVIYGDTLVFAARSAFFRARGRAYQMFAPAEQAGSTLWLPLQIFTEHLPDLYPQRLSYQSGVLRVARETVATAPAPTRDSVVAPKPAPRPKPQRVVVLDAGHGGRDPGKPGPNGVLEKNAALSIVNRLAGLLRGKGYEVHLTRTKDTLISLSDRPHLANTWKNNRPAALFMSVHANSGVRGARGFETYFLSEARTEDERRVAEMENEAVKYEDRTMAAAPELDQIVSSLKNDYYLRASHSLADLVQQELALIHPGPNRGVKQAGFRVLVGALMPAVLVEVGFISHAREERLLGTAAFQQKLAFSLAQAVDRFFQAHEYLFTTPQ
jgi:N-acetylmuramoyl-L-alanine amidase